MERGLGGLGAEATSVQTLFHTVMARIANPRSKCESVRRLGWDFGVSLPLEKVYRMMDQLDKRVVEELRAKVATATGYLLPEPLDVLFFDCTTLYFESLAEDEGEDTLRQFGYSKDGKARRVPVVLALMVTREGLPVGYEVFPGAMYEGKTFLSMMARMRCAPWVRGESRWEIDPDKIADAARWDELYGVVTNIRGMSVAELWSRYRGLWQVERGFRISKHDLKIRPIFHWTPNRIRVHLAIAYMAFACVQHLTYRVKLQKKRALSPEAIRDALLHRKCSILNHTSKPKSYLIPSAGTV